VSEPTVFDLKEGDIVEFEDIFLVEGFPVPDFNPLAHGPYKVTKVQKYEYSQEYTLEGGSGNVFLECEEEDGDKTIILQIRVDKKYPGITHDFFEIWSPVSMAIEFRGVRYYQTENDAEDECEYWDYFSSPINSDQKLFIGVEDYGDPEVGEDNFVPEYELIMGFTIPERAIKEIIPS